MQGLLIAGRYRLADSIGSGGMGRVWRAHDEVLHRTVAVKELTAALYVSDSDRAVLLARTRAEARAAARINHSAVVTVHDVLEHDGRPWIVMELVEGNSLADAVKERGRVEPAEAARIGLWVLRALRAAHSAGVLHRDVKPGNVLLGRDGRVLLTDFGIAQIEGDSTITRTGEVVGSVDYLAPERVRGQDPGPASDLWALGATLYTAVEGRSPFRRTSPLGTMQAVVEEEADEPRHAGALGPVIAALLRKEPERRPSAEEAEQMLAEAAEGRRPHTAQAFIPTQGSGLHTGGPSTSGYSPTGPTSGYGPTSGSGSTSGYGPTSGSGSTSGYGPASGSGATGTVHGPGAPGGPGRSMTGPTAVAPTPRGPAPVRPRPRRRLRTLALVVAAAAVLGGGAAVAFQEWGGMQQHTGSGTGAGPATDSPSASGSATPGGAGTLPVGWEQHHDPVGFSISLPKGWKRSVSIDQDGLRQVDYSPDKGKHLVRVAVDTAPDFRTSYEHMSNLDQRVSRRLQDYKKLSLKDELFRDQPGVRWEYTWNALAKDPPHYFPGPYHAIDVAYMEGNGTEYALYAASPADDWATTSKQFDWILRGFQEG
ncbi:serine/threonine protein kinase [Streptomyces incarnatus]|uniref:non-specific serine/threonine protein kinase n=1 Tax=Streptomyces incarnatus TaxID=665007 RepID=A0ABM5TK20_9ACTN|nr:serine/threonine-protein kinase [Streptomyces incarnatus]AKJ11300.1 serine/threonine protein kinase [Streptomyces incarnatus]